MFRLTSPVDLILNNFRYSEETKANEVEDVRDYEYLDKKEIPPREGEVGKLLVGFARDPFRYSIPEEDYRRGVR